MKLSHVDEAGNAQMVDVSEKPETKRTAVAGGFIRMSAEVLALIDAQKMPKGDVFTVAKVAGILAAKRCGELIPMCHPIPLTDVQIALTQTEMGIQIEATASCFGRTGVEMEALTAVSVTALTLYDMCKAVDKSMVIEDIKLLKKTGGKSDYSRQGGPIKDPARH
jgi:cyclic pyranopterin monophosphate synthase